MVLLLTFVVALPVVALGQEKKADSTQRPKDAGVFSGSPLFWRTDWVLDLYVTQITRHYNLNKDQEEYTRKLLSSRVKNFMEGHERDVRALMAEYMEYQTSQELPDPKAAQDFAKRAGPLAQSIRKEIFEGNMRWREILDDQQRATHDADLKQMTMFFDNLEQGLDRWKEGKVQPNDLPGRIGPKPTSLGKIEDAWDYWVKNFIRSYKLDEGQQQTALSILRELKAEATRYRDNNKEKFADLNDSLKSIRERSPKTDPSELAKYQEETAKITKQRGELEQPITALFNQLRSRVEAIPTVDQRKTRQAEVERIRLASRRPATQPMVAGSQPAATSPAATEAAK
jgi:hypothetical protein